ncbi:hypothetical protein EV702DRAFT_1213722 [Suillus placidus]|uniref:Pan3 C-terminal knob domain-containing protein n=1 Tax=Suillus placidus TaxID=48579 RepID=A0A9P6ZIH4_9AGAM|nr:hypothetical protein EV702DRAFT_1213722 [Suillus placidus]
MRSGINQFDSVILKEGGTDITIGWQIFRTHLLGWFEYTKAKHRKVIKGAMTSVTNFCDDSEFGREEEITCLVKLLNSEHCPDVQATISKLVDEQAFAELLWTSLLMPTEGLADGKKCGRVADFFPEDICTSTKCLAEDTICNLVTLLYQMMLLILRKLLGKDRKKALAVYMDHKVMSDIITAALCPMYEKPYLFPEFTQAVMRLPFIQYQNVLNFDPKMKMPRMIGKTKVARTMHDVKPISTVEAFEAGILPNNAGFQSYRSLVDVFCSLTVLKVFVVAILMAQTSEDETTPNYVFAIITTNASTSLSWLHDRQPVILTSDPDVTDLVVIKTKVVSIITHQPRPDSPLPASLSAQAINAPSPSLAFNFYPNHSEYDDYGDSVSNETPQTLEHQLVNQYQQVDYDNHASPMGNFYQSQQTMFVRQPLDYHLYSHPTPDVFLSMHCVSDAIREELHNHSETSQLVPLPGHNLPDELQGYHSLALLEPSVTEQRKFFSWYSTVYRATSSNDGVLYALRHIENFRLMHQTAFGAIETWSLVEHPSIVRVCEAFVHSTTILWWSPLPEATLWSYMTQIASAIKVVHEAGLAVRMVDATKIMVTGKNRIHIGSCGIADVLMYDPCQDTAIAQQEDLAMFGRLVFALCCNNLAAMNTLPKALDVMGRQYSADMKAPALCLISKPGPHKNITQVIDMIGMNRLLHELDDMHSSLNKLEAELMSELENGRLVRLLCKFGFINERPVHAWH